MEKARIGHRRTDLLGFDGRSVFPSKAEFGDGDVVEDDVEVPSPVGQLFPDQHGDLLALSDQLGCVELGHDAFQDLVADGREDLNKERKKKGACWDGLKDVEGTDLSINT